ncbi:cupin domain-containing protein [Lentibacillus sp. L22]|uniref:cupin domain-containing protein n=1 Tax=Lentibacillus TaxID=175304 RepID=UPI0022B09C5C|nr:cupin domain-containing protein [Lentibacillus daqui]
MAVSNMDFTASTAQYSYDLSNNPLFEKDSKNYINALGANRLNTIGNIYLLDIFLTKGNTIEPHYHPNASELTYCITGSAKISLMNSFNNKLIEVDLMPGKVASIPQGWWHYAEATDDETHLLAIHDTPMLQTVFGSDILRLTPPEVLAHTYCLNENKVKDTLAPINGTVIIGPSEDCSQNNRFPGFHYTR